jgi:hypothetical protein
MNTIGLLDMIRDPNKLVDKRMTNPNWLMWLVFAGHFSVHDGESWPEERISIEGPIDPTGKALEFAKWMPTAFTCKGVNSKYEIISGVPAWLGLKAAALAWPEAALAFQNLRPSCQLWLRLGHGLAWPGLRLSA